MIRAVWWKEYREHRSIWLTLALVGGAGLFGLWQLMAPGAILSNSSARESLQSVAILFAWTYGLVCGAMLLANEYESGTIAFLDILPARRLGLWLVKCSFGLLLLLTQIGVLAGLVIILGITETTEQFSATLVAMLIFGLVALAWSLLFSAFGDNVLNVIGLAFLGQIAGVVVVVFVLFAAALALRIVWGGIPSFYLSFQFVMACLGVLGLIVVPFFGSARVFTRLDRQRAGAARSISGPSGDVSDWTSWGRLLWLSYMQMRRLLVVLIVISFVLGFCLLGLGPAAWPVLTLLVGILCGVTVWSDEQISAAFRFLGDQRFPLGRVWIVKVGMRFALAVLAAFLLLLPSLILAVVHRFEAHTQVDPEVFGSSRQMPFSSDLFHSSLVGPIVPVWTHLSIWLLYGFSAAHLCGLLFRKSLVAAVVALGYSGMFLSLWVPSMVGIGLHFWQMAGVPLILLAAGWLLMPAWTADRLLAHGTFVRLGGVLIAVLLWTVGGLWYRVAEIPDVSDTFHLPEFAAGIPSMDQTKNPAGMEMHAAWHEVEIMTRELVTNTNAPPRHPLFPKQRGVRAGNNAFGEEIAAVLSRGWPNRPSDLGDKLDAWFQRDWYRHVLEVADHPVGVAEDAKNLNLHSHILTNWADLPLLNQVLAVRGLQMQARGKPDVFVENLRTSLALARNVQNHAPVPLVVAGRRAELECVKALDHWLENLSGHPELLERARDILLQHTAQLPDADDPIKTAYLLALNTLDQTPVSFVEEEIRGTGKGGRSVADLLRAEMELVSQLWVVPWEHERHQRILRVVFEDASKQPDLVERWGGSYMSSLDRPVRLTQKRDKREMAILSAAQLKVALRLFETKNGKFPEKLADLVPSNDPKSQHLNYLPAIPSDPFGGEFRYRVSKDERQQPEVVLSSVGEDGHPLTFRVPLPPR